MTVRPFFYSKHRLLCLYVLYLSKQILDCQGSEDATALIISNAEIKHSFAIQLTIDAAKIIITQMFIVTQELKFKFGLHLPNN